VEFSPELCAIARKNLTCAGAGADVVEGDASRYEFPEANLLIYMYNPFAEPVLDSVCDNLIHWRRKHAKEGYIAYLNPRHSACFERRSDFEVVTKTAEAQVWRIR